MNTTTIKNAIFAEMVAGHNLLEAKLIVLHDLMERVDVATDELKTEITEGTRR